MTTTSLDAALSGMIEHQRNIELIANNLANVNTSGYKRATIHFSDVFDTTTVLQALDGQLPPEDDATVEAGVQSYPVQWQFEQGPLTPTQGMLDFAIIGDGFFQVQRDDGSTAYTRDGALRLDSEARLVTAGGQPLVPPIEFPPGFSAVKVAADGSISVQRPFTEEEVAALGPDDVRDGVEEAIGQIEIVRFAFPEALEAIGGNLFRETEDSQPPIVGEPNVDGMGSVVNGYLEGSNVQIAQEMVSLVAASRAYQLNLNAYRTIQEMLRAANEMTA